jgi:cytochrome c-type biogenesis protein CcmH
MAFAIIAALLTVAASLAVLIPLGRRQPERPADSAHEDEIYRDQLAELERDAARGLIGEAEAREARAEIGRRLLAAATDKRSGASRRYAGLARALAAIAVLAVPVVAWGLYGVLGSPALPGQPLAARLANCGASSSIDELVGCAEAHLSRNPEDGRGWDVLGPIYVRMQRYPDALIAYRNAIRLLGETPDRLSGLAEAIAGTAGGVVTAEAAEPLHKALALDARHAKSRFLLALAAAQAGRADEARRDLQGLLDDLPPDSPWRDVATNAISELDRNVADAEKAPGPTSSDIEAAQSLSPQQRSAMIESMVAGLDARLRQNPADGEGWQRLVRSYVVLDRRDDAREALKRGLAALDPNGEAGRRLAELGRELGLVATE